MGEPFRHSLRVRYHECDPQGHVFNANYLAYADIAITELYREAFGSWEVPMDEHGLDMVVAEANARYLAPLRFDEEIDLVVTITRIGGTSKCVSGVTRPASSAEAIVTTLLVDPGSNTSVTGRLRWVDGAGWALCPAGVRPVPRRSPC